MYLQNSYTALHTYSDYQSLTKTSPLIQAKGSGMYNKSDASH